MFNSSEDLDMRALFKSYKDKQNLDSALLNGTKIEESAKKAEIQALNSTLDDIVLEISIQK